MKPEQAARFRALIIDRLTALTGTEADKRREARPVELDQTRVGRLSRQDALQAQALSVSSLARSREEVIRLRSALTRIDDGDYGWCEECGEEIPEGRLEADPGAELCLRCARTRE